jgi:hypothetical protein
MAVDLSESKKICAEENQKEKEDYELQKDLEKKGRRILRDAAKERKFFPFYSHPTNQKI